MPTPVMAHDVDDQHTSWVSWPRELPEPTPGTAALVQESAVVGAVIAPDENDRGAGGGAGEHADGRQRGRPVWVSEVTGLPDTVGRVSLAKVAPAVGAAYMTRGTSPAPLVPVAGRPGTRRTTGIRAR